MTDVVVSALTPPQVEGPKSERVEVARGSDGRPILLPRSVVVAAAWSWRLLLIGVAIYVAFFVVLARTQVVTTPLLLAVLIAALLHPLYRVFRRARVPGVLSALLAIGVFVVVLAGVLYFVGQQIVTGVSDLLQSAGSGLTDLTDRLSFIPGVDADVVQRLIDQGQEQVTGASGLLASGALSVTSTATTVLTGFLLALFATIFFLSDGPRVWRFVTALLPREGREPARIAGEHAWRTIGVYVRTVPLVALVDSSLIGGGAAILGVPFALPIALVTFLAAFVPVVGAVVAGVLAVLVALVSNGTTAAVIMLIIILGVQQLDGNVLQPFLLGRALDLHPLAVVLATSVGIILAGITGGVLAVPLVSVAVVAVQSLRREDAAAHLSAREAVGDGSSLPPGDAAR